MEQVKPITEFLTKEEIYQLYCEQIQEIEQLKTTLESSISTTQSWVDKHHKLNAKYEQALEVIASKKIMEMQEDNKNLQADLKQANALLQWEQDYSEKKHLKNIELAEKAERYEKALKDIAINCDNPSFRVVAKMALENKN